MGNVIVWTRAYNAEKTLRRTMDSILNQTYGDLEYYILDNASTDSTYEIIKEYAARDSRVIPLHRKKNSLEDDWRYWSRIFHHSPAKWFCRCDADDEYTLDFLEKMVAFAEENTLEMAICGYERVDSETGRVFGQRKLDSSMILSSHQDFLDHFVEYRTFTFTEWGRIISLKLLSRMNFRRDSRKKQNHYKIWQDSILILNMMRKSKRIGIYPEIMFRYYQYPNSLVHLINTEWLESFSGYHKQLETYLLSFGSISQRNRDFLYAIYFSNLKLQIDYIFSSRLSLEEQLGFIQIIFSKRETIKLFERKASTEFKILEKRKIFIQDLKAQLLERAHTNSEKEALEPFLNELDCIAKKISF